MRSHTDHNVAASVALRLHQPRRFLCLRVCRSSALLYSADIVATSTWPIDCISASENCNNTTQIKSQTYLYLYTAVASISPSIYPLTPAHSLFRSAHFVFSVRTAFFVVVVSLSLDASRKCTEQQYFIGFNGKRSDA